VILSGRIASVLGLLALVAGAIAVYVPVYRVSATIDSTLQREEDTVADSLKQRLLADAEEDVQALAGASRLRSLAEIKDGHGEAMRQALNLSAFALLDGKGRARAFFGALDTPSGLGRIEPARRIADQMAGAPAGQRYRGFVLAYGQAYVAAATSVELSPATPGGQPETLVAISFTRVAHSVLARLSLDYRLRGLDFAQEPIPGRDALPLADLRGGIVGYLVWTQSSPTEDMLTRLGPWIVGVVMAVILILAALILLTLRAHQTAAAAQLETQVLTKSDRAKSMLFANLSHEFRTPLNAVIGFSDVMRLRMFGPLGHDRYAEYVDDIHSSATHLLALIEDVLTLSRYEANDDERLDEAVSLTAAIRDVQRMLSPATEAKDVQLLVDISGDPVVCGSEKAIRQIIANLAGNAIKYTEHGFVRISAVSLPGCDKVALTVSDTGVGIPREHLDRILRPFEQVDDVYTRKQGGTGLGLSIVSAIMKRAGGSMRIESAVGEGTRVMLYLQSARKVEAAGAYRAEAA
jgi:signal transduction histidine kinase